MANEVKITVSADTQRAQRAMSGLSQRLQGVADKARAIRGPLLGISAAALGGLGVATKLAEDQRQQIGTLDAVLQTLNTTYDAQKETIESVTEALQRKTNYGDNVQREAMIRLIPILGSTEKALAALPVILDAAAVSGSSVGTVALTMGRALGGMANTAESAGLTFDETAGFAERVAAATEAIGGAAEGAASPIDQLRNRMKNLGETMGDSLLPAVNNVTIGLEKLVRAAEALPEPIHNTAVAAVGLVGAFALMGLGLPPILAGATMMGRVFGALGTVITPIAAGLGLLAGIFFETETGLRAINAEAQKMRQRGFDIPLLHGANYTEVVAAIDEAREAWAELEKQGTALIHANEANAKSIAVVGDRLDKFAGFAELATSTNDEWYRSVIRASRSLKNYTSQLSEAEEHILQFGQADEDTFEVVSRTTSAINEQASALQNLGRSVTGFSKEPAADRLEQLREERAATTDPFRAAQRDAYISNTENAVRREERRKARNLAIVASAGNLAAQEEWGLFGETPPMFGAGGGLPGLPTKIATIVMDERQVGQIMGDDAMLSEQTQDQ